MTDKITGTDSRDAARNHRPKGMAKLPDPKEVLLTFEEMKAALLHRIDAVTERPKCQE